MQLPLMMEEKEILTIIVNIILIRIATLDSVRIGAERQLIRREESSVCIFIVSIPLIDWGLWDYICGTRYHPKMQLVPGAEPFHQADGVVGAKTASKSRSPTSR
jgi:hypothetical protein